MSKNGLLLSDARHPATDTCMDVVVDAFNGCFAASHRTLLVGGAQEPYYEVLSNGHARVYFREDFVSSALHEAAHWCLAGKERRMLNDYGYWYESERDAIAQQRFETVEAKPQALEWIFSLALGLQFKISADNLDLKDYDNTDFKHKVQQQAYLFVQNGRGPRASQFLETLDNLRQGLMDVNNKTLMASRAIQRSVLTPTNFEELPR